MDCAFNRPASSAAEHWVLRCVITRYPYFAEPLRAENTGPWVHFAGACCAPANGEKLARRLNVNSRTSLNAAIALLVLLSGCSATEQARFELFFFALLSFGALMVQAVASGPALFVKKVGGWRSAVALVVGLVALTSAGVLLAAATASMLGHSFEVRADGEVKSSFVAIVVMGLLQVVLLGRLLEVMAPQRKPDDEFELPLMRPIRVVVIPAAVAYIGLSIWIFIRVFAK